MASPDEFIEILDFSPGIHGDYHAASAPQFTSDDNMEGALLGNGAARIEGTERCRVDRSGALVPLPKMQPLGVRDGIGPTYSLQPNREFRYLLDVQLGPTQVDSNLTEATPFPDPIRRAMHLMWGYWADDNDNYHPVTVGREYRLWLSLAETDSLFDFILADAVGETVDGMPVYPLPVGSVCDGRFYLGNTQYELVDQPAILAAGTGQGVIPDDAAFDIVGDLVLYCRIAPTKWASGGLTQVLINKYTPVGQESYRFRLGTDGRLTLDWRDAGLASHAISSTVTVPTGTGVIDGEYMWVAVTLDVNNGAAGHDVRFWTADPQDSGFFLGPLTWTQLGTTVTTGGTTTIFSGTAPVELCGQSNIGASGLKGSMTHAFIGAGSGANTPANPASTALFLTPLHLLDTEPSVFETSAPTRTVTLQGQIAVVVPAKFGFKPAWMYPVTVAMAATPWAQWGAGNLMRNGALTAPVRYGLGLAPAFVSPYAFYPPAIGFEGIGTSLVGMNWHNPGAGIFPQSSVASYWYFHYSEEDNVFGQGVIEGGPVNPYLLIAHQGRVVMPDRRRGRRASTVSSDKVYGFADDLLWYSDYAVPCQVPFLVPLDLQGKPLLDNDPYGTYPRTTHEPYNKLLIAEDDVSEIGTIGVTTVDQLLVVKHHTGGAMVSGDLDRPSIRRLPYIESTGGVICKGTNTPIGFVYGSNNGIFVWQGGDNTTKLSLQIDGFFWDHTNGTDEETYAGSRGRMAYWNNLVCVPNNYLFDIESQSWWRFRVTDLEPISSDIAPYNCYDRDEQGNLYAFPYRNKWPATVSRIIFPSAQTGTNMLTVPDEAAFASPTALDIRFAISGVGSGSTTRHIISQYDQNGNNRSWRVHINSSDQLVLTLSTNGSTDAFTLTSSALPANDDLILCRVTWSTTPATNNVQFWTKAGVPQHSIAAALRANDSEWVQLGASQTGAVAALFNSAASIYIGSAVGVNPFVGTLYAVSFRTVPVASVDPPVFSIIPTDIPSNELATSFTANTGQTVTVVRAVSGPVLDIEFEDHPVPVWHQFDQRVLDNEYHWHSHPLVETRGRTLSFQNVQMLATGKDDSDTTTIAVTLEGIDRAGNPVATNTVTFTLDASPHPQLLRKDIEDNFTAEYVSIRIHALDSDVNVPAPKIHGVKLGVKPRATTPRHG